MAKALVGYLPQSDPRVVASLTSENRRLRQLVADLEARLSRLEEENDALAASLGELTAETLLSVPDQMQPA
jgi:hemerythrin-like domain-containing protein